MQILYTDDLCAGEQVFFAATGVSDGDLLQGVRYYSGGASTNSLVMRSSSGTGDAPANGSTGLRQICPGGCRDWVMKLIKDLTIAKVTSNVCCLQYGGSPPSTSGANPL